MKNMGPEHVKMARGIVKSLELFGLEYPYEDRLVEIFRSPVS
jgi:hypothetical protein